MKKIWKKIKNILMWIVLIIVLLISSIFWILWLLGVTLFFWPMKKKKTGYAKIKRKFAMFCIKILMKK